MSNGHGDGPSERDGGTSGHHSKPKKSKKPKRFKKGKANIARLWFDGWTRTGRTALGTHFSRRAGVFLHVLWCFRVTWASGLGV